MTADFDVIIVGSGPAGVSAAWPFVQAGLSVLMVDGGREMGLAPPSQPYLTVRANDTEQWKWMVGGDYHALKFSAAVSPKLRAPTHAYVFEGYAQSNHVTGNDFVALGSLARGGLSNAWGCGVARLSAKELSDYPFPPAEIEASYATVTQRMGVSGAIEDDLSEYFGVDAWAEAPIGMDALQTRLYTTYRRHQRALIQKGFRLGRSRVAALSQDRLGRQACDLSGNCLWGCHRKSLYSATDDLSALRQYPNFIYRSGFIVDRISPSQTHPCIQGHDARNTRPESLSARKLVLAAGTLATTRLVMMALEINRPITMQACPVAAFMLWRPLSLGQPHSPAFGLGQLSFSVALQGNRLALEGADPLQASAFGSLFNTTGIPISEFAKFMPFRKPLGIQFLKSLLSSCVVGNAYLPGAFTQASLSLDSSNTLQVSGRYHEDVDALMRETQQKLRSSFLKLGALMLPKSFTLSKPGGDLHHACSLPMRSHPVRGETHADGELSGLKDIHVVDGACLTAISEKSHTLTIMANADRIARQIAHKWSVSGGLAQ